MNVEIVKLREVVTKLVPLLTGKGLTVTQRGSKAYVDVDPVTRRPKSVNIPNIPDTASPDFVRAINGFIDHEVAHVLFTDYAVYGSEIRTKADEKDPKKANLTLLHNMMEDTFVEREIVKIFPGSKRNLSDLREHFLRKVTEPALASAASEQEQLKYLLVTAFRALAGQPEFEQFMDDGKYWDHPLLAQFIKAMDPKILAMLKTARNSTETMEIAKAVYKVLFPVDPPPPPESGEGGDGDQPDKEAGPGKGKGKRKHSGEKSEGKPDGKSESSDAGESDKDEEDGEKEKGGKGAEEDEDGEESDSSGKGEGDKDKDENEEEGESESSGGNPEGPDDDASENSQASATFASEFEETERGQGTGVGSSDTSKSMFDLQEDALKGVDVGEAIAQEISEEAAALMSVQKTWTAFTREFDVIEPLKPTHLNDSWVPTMEDETKHLTASMQKDIERMLASSGWVIRTPGHRKGKLHTPSLYKMNMGEDRVFSQRQEHRSTNTAVTLLVDNSGSMSGEKCKLAMISAFALSTTLERVKVNHEVIGFTTGHYSYSPELNRALQRERSSSSVHYDREIPLVMPIYKAFGERISPEVKRRFAFTTYAQAGLSGNIDGESLQIAAERLMRQPEKRKVILVLSDGQPAGGANSGAHLKYVVDDLNARGIDTIGIGIMDNSVSRYYKKHVVLNNVSQLPGQVMTELKKILAA